MKLSIAPASDIKQEKIKRVVTKKLYGKQKPDAPLKTKHPIELFLEGLIGIVMVIPAIIFAVAASISVGISVGFEAGMVKALMFYRGQRPESNLDMLQMLGREGK